ncbi:MAG TPA: hypothetical protein VK524_05645 [Polyangiaceae bacterium]|nr:hypothetical protein [Polyangiaceae bacterium]
MTGSKQMLMDVAGFMPGKIAAALAMLLASSTSCTSDDNAKRGNNGSSQLAVTPPPADVVVYGRRPATFRNGTTPFVPSGGIFEHRQQTDDPLTRLKFREVAGLENRLGVFPDRIGSFGKYIFLGNSQTSSIGGNPVASTIGVFDSEAKGFCSLALSQYPASTNNLVTANPRARKSRIIFGTGTKAGGDVSAVEPALSYALADLDSSNPCAWPVLHVTAPQLNAGFPEGEQLCPGNFCIFDSMALLGHEEVAGDPYGRDYVMLGEYFNAHLAVVRVDSSGATVVDTFTNGVFATPATRACYKGGAARRPSSDFRVPDTRPANDWRALFSYDAFLLEVYATTPPAYCAPPRPFCPLDVAPDGARGTACSGSCVQRYCAKDPAQACAADNTCVDRVYGVLPVGPCVNSCLPKAPFATCRTSTGAGSRRQCLRGAPNQCAIAGEACSSEVPPIVGPAQEYRFNRTTNALTATSPIFFAPGTNGSLEGVTPTSNFHDSADSVWVQADGPGNPSLYRAKSSGETCTVDGQSVPAPAGEHCYYNLANPPVATVVTPDQTVVFERTNEIPYIATTAEISGRMYVADTGSMQYAQQYGAWFAVAPNDYKVDFGFASSHVKLDNPLTQSALPAELRRCSALTHLRACNTDADCGPNGGSCTAPRRCSGSFRACNVNGDCPAANQGESCLPPNAENGANIYSAFKFVEAGGAPTSLWVTSGYYQGPPVAQSDLFLVRVPAAATLTENLSLTRPAIAWDGNRLWLVSEQGGQLRYRIRDDGQWSAWFALGTNDITPAGGAAVMAGAGGLRIYARDTAGRVHEKRLTSGSTCAPGSCAWSSWAALPVRATNDDITATYAGSQRVVAVRGSDDRIYATVGGTSWGSWFVVGSLLTNAAPSVTHHAPDGRVWIAARQRDSGVLHYSRIDPSTRAVEAWLALPTTGAPASWGAAPVLVSDGQAVRVFAVTSAFPQWAFQSANDGSGWSEWRKPIGGSWGTRQPAAASINGEIDLVTYWYTGGMQEASLP